MADKFGGKKDGRQTTGATFYDVPSETVNANALYFPNFPASPFFGIAEYPVAAGDLGAFSTSGVFVFDKPVGWIDNPGRKVFYRPKTAATGEIVAQEIKGDVFVGYQIVDNINPQKLGVLLAGAEFCMNVLIVTSTADSGAGSLRQAIADAQDGDVILFDADVFPVGQTTSILLSSYIAINKSISIYGGESDGNGGYTSGAVKRFYVYREIEGVKTKVVIDDDNPAQDDEIVLFENVCRVALDGQGAVRCVYNRGNATCIFSGVAFINGNSNGGGLYVYETATATVNDCAFDSCTGANGGGIYTGGTAETTVNNCSFVSCSGTSGGALQSTTNSRNTLNGCVIDGCNATNGGGVFSVFSSQNTLNGCIITNCSATNGGGVYSAGTSQNTLNDCTISGCNATSNGGGVYSTSTSQNTLNDCTITGCSATSNGGAVYAASSSVCTFAGCMITGNTATSSSGGVYCYTTGALNLNDCAIKDNIASGTAKDINVYTDTTATVNNSIVGYIRVANSGNLTINGISLIDNLTLSNDATITIDDGAALTITTSATFGAATFTSAGRGYLAVASGINVSAATLTNVVLCSYGAGLETFAISADGASWTAQDLTTPILIETRDAGGDWQTLTDDATGGEYATTFALESTARAFDGVAFFVATLPGYWQADAGAVDANVWSVKGFAAANSNGGGDAQGDAAQGWTVTPSTVTPNADGV